MPTFAENQLTIARLADLGAWQALQTAKAELDAAAFNLGDDLDRLAAAAGKLQEAAQELKLMRWRFDFAQHMAEREAFAQRTLAACERAAALDYDDDAEETPAEAQVRLEAEYDADAEEMPLDVQQEAEAEMQRHMDEQGKLPCSKCGRYPHQPECFYAPAPAPVPQYRNSQGQIVYDIDPGVPEGA